MVVTYIQKISYPLGEKETKLYEVNTYLNLQQSTRRQHAMHFLCVVKSNIENSALLGYYTASSSKSLPTFRDKLSGPIFKAP